MYIERGSEWYDVVDKIKVRVAMVNKEEVRVARMAWPGGTFSVSRTSFQARFIRPDVAKVNGFIKAPQTSNVAKNTGPRKPRKSRQMTWGGTDGN